MGAENDQIEKTIRHYQERLERYISNKDETKILYILNKLRGLPIKTVHLENTGVGRSVNALKKLEGNVGEVAKSVVAAWKDMVLKEEQDAEEEKHISDEQSVDCAVDSSNSSENDGENDKSKNDKVLETNEDYGADNPSQKSSKNERSHKKDDESHKSDDKKRTKKSYKEDRKESTKHKYSDSKMKDSNSKITNKSRDSRTKIKHGAETVELEEKYEVNFKKHKGTNKHNSEIERSSHKSDGRENKSNTEGTSRNTRESSHTDVNNQDEYRIKHERSSSSKNIYKRKHESSESDSDTDSHKSVGSTFSNSSEENDKRKKYRSQKSKHSSKKSNSDEVEFKSKTSGHLSNVSDDEVKHKPKRTRHNSSDSSEDEISKKKSSSYHSSSLNEAESLKDRKSKSKDRDGASRKHSNEKYKKSKHREPENKRKSRHDGRKDRESQDRKDDKSEKSKDTRKNKERHKNKDKSSSLSHIKSNVGESEKKNKDDVKNSGDAIKSKIANGIDSGSGASFAEALGMCGPLVNAKSSAKKKITTNSSYSEKNNASSSKVTKDFYKDSDDEFIPEPLLRQPNLDPININISSLLPEITPNYRPLGLPIENREPKFSITDDEALSRVMANKNLRTKVYSGNKSYGKLDSLFDLCVRVLQENLDALEYTGGVPYCILKVVLEKATPNQLFSMEHHNPYLIEDTDELWQLHCQREFRNKKREELESWREMYMRCLDEREARLNEITASIKQSQDKSIPVRTTKLAYVDSVVKPPRNIAKKQAKNGIIMDRKPISPAERLQQIAKSGDAGKVSVPNPGSRALERSSNISNLPIKPKKAPLMAKTLSLFKNRFRR